MSDLSQYSDAELMAAANSIPMGNVDAAITKQESGGNINAPTSIDGAIGPSQIIPATFARFAQPGEDIHNSEHNMAVAQRYRDYLSQRFNGDPARIATAYFSGEGNVAPPDSPTPWLHDRVDGNGKKVSSYVSDVMGRMGKQYAQNTTQANDANPSDAPSQYSDAELMAAAKHYNPDSASSGSTGLPKEVSGSEAFHNILPDDPGYTYGSILPFKKNNATGEKSLAVPEAIRAPIHGIGDLFAMGENKSVDMTPDALNAMMTTVLPAEAAGSPFGKAPILSSKSAGGSIVGKLLKDESGAAGEYAPPSAPPVPEFLKPAKPLPESLMRAGDEPNAAPLMVTPASVKHGQTEIANFLQNDGIDLHKVASDLEAAQKINPNVTALDVMAKDEGGIPQGNNMVGVAKSIAQTPGQGRTMLQQMAGRGYTASQRIGDNFDGSLSKAPYYKVENDAVQSMDGSGPLYEKAYASNKDVSSPVINRLLKTDAGNQALKYAANRMNTKMSLMGVPDPELVEQAQLAGTYNSGGISNGLKLQTLQYVKEGYDNQIGAAFSAGEKGKAADLIEQKNGLLRELDKIDGQTSGGAYAQARSTYATGAKIKDALEQGRSFMSMDPEEIKAFMQDKGRSNPEKLAFASGTRRALQDMIDNQSETTNPINKLWKPALQKRLQAIMPEDSYNNFAANMQHEKVMARINGKLQGGSDTVEKASFAKPQAKSAFGNLIRFSSDPLAATGNVMGDFADKAIAKQAQNMSQNSKVIIARYLTTKNPALLRDLADRIGQKPTIENKP